MGAMDEWANDPEPRQNPWHHNLLAVGAILALPIVEWWDDRKPWERVAIVGKAVIVLACAAAVVFLTGCRPEEQKPADVPGIDRGHVEFNTNQALEATR
jgi:hypothetical protein